MNGVAGPMNHRLHRGRPHVAATVYRLNEGRPNVVDMIKNGQMQMIINTPSGMMPRQDENKIRTAAVLNNVSIMTTMAGASAALRGIKAMEQKRVGVRSLQGYVGNVL